MVSAMNAPITPLVLHLPYQPPWDWAQFHAHFALRRLAGVETLGEAHYRRSLRLDGVPGWMDIRPLAGEPALRLELHLDGAADSAPLAARVRKMFDLDSDPRAVAAHLGADPLLRPLVEAWPGLRLPCAFDPFEQAVRAIVGQQVTVKAAVTITGRGSVLPVAGSRTWTEVVSRPSLRACTYSLPSGPKPIGSSAWLPSPKAG